MEKKIWHLKAITSLFWYSFKCKRTCKCELLLRLNLAAENLFTPAPCSLLLTSVINISSASLQHMAENQRYSTCSSSTTQMLKRCSYLARRFSLTVFENYFITEEDEESCLWLPAALGWLFLAQGSRVESFHKWSTLCSVKEN